MQLGKVHIDQVCLVALLNHDLLFVIHGILIVVERIVLGVSAINHELLRDAVWLDDDVLNKDWLLRDFEASPALSFIPTVFNEGGGLVFACNDNDCTVVTDLVNMHANSHGSPSQTTVTRHEQSFLGVVCSEFGAKISCSKNNTNGFFTRVNWSKFAHMRVNLQVQRTAILNVAGSLFASHCDFGGFDELPLATLVVSDVSLYVFLGFGSWHRLFDLVDLVFSFPLLAVLVTTVAHARVASVSGLFSNHVCFVPLLLMLIIISPVINNVVIVGVPVHPCHQTWAVLVGDEGAIQRCDTLKVDSASLDHILETQGKRPSIAV